MKSRHITLATILAVSACSILDPDGPDLSISVQPDVNLPASMSFHVTVGGDAHDLRLGTERTRYGIERHAPRDGELNVSVALRDAADRTLAQASFDQVFKEGSDHWVSGIIGTRRPIGHCIGTLVVVPIIPPVAAGGDSLFIMYGSIPKGAIC